MTATTVPTPHWAQPGTDLTGTTVLVIGGSGAVGEGVTRALLTRGATVIATSRSPGKAIDLGRRVGSQRLYTHALDLLEPGLDGYAAALIEEFDALQGVVLSVADWGQQGRKRLIDLSDHEWDTLIAQNQTTIFRGYRAFIPTLAHDGVIVQLNGLSADLPFPGAGGVALTAAATKSMTRTIAQELHGAGPRVYEVILGVIRTRARQLAGFDDPDWIPATDVGVHVAELVAATSPLTTQTLHYFFDRAIGPQPGPRSG